MCLIEPTTIISSVKPPKSVFSGWSGGFNPWIWACSSGGDFVIARDQQRASDLVRKTMSRTLMTAATIRSAALHVRMPVGFDLRQASLDLTLTRAARMMSRMAARYVLGKVDSADYDIMARLQILEGASGAPTGPHAGRWWKKGRGGLKAAMDAFAGTDIDPSWFSTGNTGMISKVFGMVRSEHNKWSRNREVHFSPDDIIQNGIMGLTKDGQGALKKGPYFFQFGALNKGVKAGIPRGKETPQGVAGIVAKFFVQNVSDEFSAGDRQRVPTVTETGDSVFDSMTRDPKKFYDVLQDLLADPRSPVRDLINRAFLKQMGDGKWADIATELFVSELTGKRVNKGELAKQHGMAGGTLSKIIRTKMKPAIADLQRDRNFLNEVRDHAERAMMRAAHQRIVRKAALDLDGFDVVQVTHDADGSWSVAAWR